MIFPTGSVAATLHKHSTARRASGTMGYDDDDDGDGATGNGAMGDGATGDGVTGSEVDDDGDGVTGEDNDDGATGYDDDGDDRRQRRRQWRQRDGIR